MAEFGFGQEPIDQSYKRFRDGWSTWIIGKTQAPGLRWSPLEGGGDWRAYRLDRFDYIDFGVGGPKSPLEHRWTFGDRPGYIWNWDGFFTPAWKLPDLWREVSKVYGQVKGARPAAVWNPYDGSWREMHSRAPAPPPSGAPPSSGAPSTTELERRLDELIRLYRAGRITDELFKLRALELTREYG